MTDKEYIEAFLVEDQRAFSQFYAQKEKDIKIKIVNSFEGVKQSKYCTIFKKIVSFIWKTTKVLYFYPPCYVYI